MNSSSSRERKGGVWGDAASPQGGPAVPIGASAAAVMRSMAQCIVGPSRLCRSCGPDPLLGMGCEESLRVLDGELRERRRLYPKPAVGREPDLGLGPLATLDEQFVQQ